MSRLRIFACLAGSFLLGLICAVGIGNLTYSAAPEREAGQQRFEAGMVDHDRTAPADVDDLT